MKTRTTIVLMMLVAAALPARPAGRARASETHDRAVEARIDSLLSVMTLEEKCGQLNQIGGPRTDSLHHIVVDDTLRDAIRSGMIGSFLNVTGGENTGKLQRIAVEESRLRIPLIFGLDVIHGFRTVFPIPLAEACSWDTALVREAAGVAAREASAAGIHWTFAPMVDIARDPRWGRIAEGSGEDPFLGSAMASARVKGFQGNDLAKPGNILACAKHFAAYGAAEGGRDYNVADMSERTLRSVPCAVQGGRRCRCGIADVFLQRDRRSSELRKQVADDGCASE